MLQSLRRGCALAFALAAVSFSAFFNAGCQQEDVLAPSSETIDAELDREAAIEASAGLSHAGPTPIAGPTVITKSGRYRVTEDFQVLEGDGIVIRCSHVVLDLGGHTITGPGNKLGRGIVLEGSHGSVLRKGRLERFGIGVALLGSNESTVRQIDIVGGDEFADPPNGVAPQIGSLLVNSAENSILNNDLSLVNLGIFVRGGDSFENRIRKNQVTGGANGLLGICYNPAEGEGPGGPHDDDLRNNVLNRFGTGIQFSVGSAENRFARNTVYYFASPWNDFNGSNEFVGNTTMQVTP